MLRDAELLCQNRPVALRLGQQHHEVGVVQDCLDLPAGQQVFHVLRQGRGDAALFAEHLPHSHEVAGGEGVPEQDVELVKVAPRRNSIVEVGVHRRGHKVVGDVHGDLPQVFPQPLQHDAHHAGRQVHVGGVVKEVEGAGAVELQGRRHPLGLRLRLFQKFLVQVLEQGRFPVPDPQGQLPVHLPHTAVNDSFFNGLQSVLAAHHQLAQGEQEVRLHGQGALVPAQVKLDVHRVDMVGAVRGDLDYLPAQPPHQRGIFPHRVYDDDAVLGRQKHVDDLPFGRKTLAGAGGAEIEPVGRFQFFPVCHDDIVGEGVHAVVEGLPAHAELPGHKGHEDGGGAGGHAPLDLHLVMAQHQRGHITLLLLPVQPLDGAVIFLRDAIYREHVVLQPLAGGGEVDDGEGQQEHPLVAGLQVGEQVGGVLGERDEVRGQDVRVIPGPDRLFLLLHLHLVDVGHLALDGLDGLELVYRLDVHGDGELRVQLQNLPQQLVRELGRQDLQIRRRAPIAAHPEQAGLGEVKAPAGGDGVLGAKAGLGDVRPGEPERLPAAGVHLAVEHRQPFPSVQRIRLHPQSVEVSHHIGLHPLQPGAGLAQRTGRDAKGDVLGPVNAVVALGDLPLEHGHELAPDAVIGVLLGGDIHLVPAGAVGPAVDKGELERQGAVKVVEEGAPAAENSGLILAACHRVVDVLIFHGLGEQAAGELTHPVRVHRHIGDGLLGGHSPPAPAVSPCGLFSLRVCFLQSHPPFPSRPAG